MNADELDAGQNEDEQPADDGAGGGLSQHPEAVRARARRREARAGSKGGGSSSSSSRRRSSAPQTEIRARLLEALTEIAEWLEGRDEELARVLKRDAPKQADLLSKWAEHPKSPPFIKGAILVVAELLEPVRAFGGTFRLILRRLRERAARREQEADLIYEPVEVPQPGGEGLDEEPQPQPAPVDVTPERFRV